MNITQYKDKVLKAGLSDEATRVLLGLEFQIHGEEAYIDSLQIAELLGIEHYDLLKIIRKFVDDQDKLGHGKLSYSSKGIIESTYVNSQNKKQPLFLLNEKSALRITMKSNSKNADRIQDIIAEGFLLLRDMLTQSVPMNPFELMVKQAQALLDHDLAIKAQQKQLDATASQVVQLTNTVTELVGGLGYVTVKGYATRVKRPLDNQTAVKLGKACSKLCEERGLKKSYVNDERHGKVGSYPTEIVKEVFDAYFLFN